MTTLTTALREIGACEVALEWLEARDFGSPQEAWDACDRVDWMTWLQQHYQAPEPDRRVVAAACLPAFRDTDPTGGHPVLDAAAAWLAGHANAAAFEAVYDASEVLDGDPYTFYCALHHLRSLVLEAGRPSSWLRAILEDLAVVQYDQGECDSSLPDLLRTLYPHPPLEALALFEAVPASPDPRLKPDKPTEGWLKPAKAWAFLPSVNAWEECPEG